MTIEIPLSKKGRKYAGMYTAIVDDCDAILAELNWSVKHDAVQNLVYAHRGFMKDGKKIMATLHHAICERMGLLGSNDGRWIDHRNRNGLDCTRGNLRLVTPSQSTLNTNYPIKSSTGFRGIYLREESGRFRAVIGFNKKRVNIGHFDTPEEAWEARQKRGKELFGDFWVED